MIGGFGDGRGGRRHVAAGKSGFATATGCIIPLTNFLPVTFARWGLARAMRQDVA
jgi:hypothetical protein